MENSRWDVDLARTRGEIDAFLDPLDREFPMVSTEDIGRLTAKTLQQEWSGNRYLELEGRRRYSQLEAAAILSRLLGRAVRAKKFPAPSGQSYLKSKAWRIRRHVSKCLMGSTLAGSSSSAKERSTS